MSFTQSWINISEMWDVAMEGVSERASHMC